MLFLCFRPKLWFKTFWDTFFFYPNLNVNKEGYWQATQRPGGVVLKDMRVRLKSCLRASRRTGGVCFDDVLLRLHHRLHVHTLSSAYRRATLWVLFINHSQIEDIYGMTHTHTHTRPAVISELSGSALQTSEHRENSSRDTSASWHRVSERETWPSC